MVTFGDLRQNGMHGSLFTAWGVFHRGLRFIPWGIYGKEPKPRSSRRNFVCDLYHVKLFQRGFSRPFRLILCILILECHLFLACGPVWFETLRDITFAIPITPGAKLAILLFASIDMTRRAHAGGKRCHRLQQLSEK